MATLWMPMRLLLLLASLILDSLGEVRVDKEYKITAGHAMVLPCKKAKERELRGSVRVDGVSLDTLPDIQLQNHSIWFLPAQVKHSGVYNSSGRFPYFVRLTVGEEPCPEGDHVELYKSRQYVRLDCDRTMDHIIKVFPPSSVTWLKECKPLPRGNVNGHELDIENVSTADAGAYTCVVNFTYEGRNYTAARTTKLTIDGPIQRHRTQIKIPLNETRAVTIGSQEELRCEATEIQNEITTINWKMNGTPILDSSGSSDFKIKTAHGNNTSVNTLTIIEVKAKHLNVNFTCMATNALGSAISTVVLIEANEGHGHGWLVAGICLCVLLIACVLLWHCFKVDLVLLYRSLCPRKHDNDGKHYDAYVSYPYESQGLSMTFALRLLPEVLENKHGYKLFIRGRDDDPGQDVFEVIVNALQKSRRVILVLEGAHRNTHCAQVAICDPTHTETSTPLSSSMATHTLMTSEEADTRTQLNGNKQRGFADQASAHSTQLVCLGKGTDPVCDAFEACLDTSKDSMAVTCGGSLNAHIDPAAGVWGVSIEQDVVIHDTLLRSGINVIVIQTGHLGRKEENLPTSLGQLKHSRKVLRWRAHTHTPSHTHTSTQRRFWKKLRYLMPIAMRTSAKSTTTTTTTTTRTSNS